MVLRVRFWLLLLGLVTCLAGLENSFAQTRVIYGVDTRTDIKSTTPVFKTWARSTAAMISKDKLTNSDDLGLTFKLTPESGEDLSSALCEGERFKGQVTSAVCTGFLIAPDLIVTAGHCMEEINSCENMSWVFDFNNDNMVVGADGQENYFVKSKDIYNCKEIVAQKLDPAPGVNDYAIVRLDRKVEDRAPLKFRKEGKVSNDDKLVLIGHPMGLPMKVADGAVIRNNDNDLFFLTNTNSFQGNSGSPVFSSKTGQVEGILVRGENDFETDKAKRCLRVKVCPSTGCRGEDVTRITNILDDLKNLKY